MGIAFFLFLDNINVNKHRQNRHLYNNSYQVAYIVKYICFISSESNHRIDGNWQQRYLDANQIDYSAAKKLITNNFLLEKKNLEHYSHPVRYILSNIFSNDFLQALDKEKIRY